MNNKKICQPAMNTLVKGGMSVLLASIMAAGAQAEGMSAPKLVGKLNVGMIKAGTDDLDTWANRVELGIVGDVDTDDGIKLKYELIADLSGELNGNDNTGQTWVSGDNNQVDGAERGDIELRSARVMMITDYGMVLVAPRTFSGQWYQLYGNIDKFEYNRFHGQTGLNAIFGQVEQADDVMAYISPEIVSGLRFVGAVLTVNNANGKSADVQAWRFVYAKGALSAGFGNVMTSGKLLPTKTTGETADSYNRTAATVGYKADGFYVGATYEMNDYGSDSKLFNFDSFAVVAEASLTDKLSLTLGYADKNSDNDALDNNAIVGKLKYQAAKSTYYYLESGQYDLDTSADNVLAGINISF